ncbi:uncharacterized protein STEHIDRAFT_150447 [Stereum hirsutum FP-91666 SS1]|uniref:uncharacterized protein n=1 Tax=Stereum hirsutum (strain FP-91666) TaxID=721885 RepID=UPI000444A095|nr:uncharacterized protein STEHIDRAFT_150447 [Stereum hirsutum FP-91666 SS1]EIM80757.1 hypothetical protein STEHIDRAFT_150447 [Stereum hirsutum FP-91666 SS1]
MLACRALYFLLALVTVGVLAIDENTRIANRTIERTVQLRTHSLYAPYIDQDLQNRWWDFGADAYVNTNKHVRLTRNKQSLMGWLWSRLPITASNYIIEIEFKISGESTHLFGDGMAIWLTKDRAQPGPIFGSIDKFNGLAIFLDTYANGRHNYDFPRIVAMMGDGQTSYDQAHDGDETNIAACSAKYRRTNVATKLKITYAKDSVLDVKIQYQGWDQWDDCFTVKGVSIPANPYLGFSAMTGDVSDAHDIISVSSYSAVLSQPDAQRDKHRSDPSSLSSSFSSFFSTLFKLALFVGVCAGAWYGWMTYGRKRFGGGGGGGFGGVGGGGMGGLSGGRGGFGGLGEMGRGLGNGLGSAAGGLWQDPKRF